MSLQENPTIRKFAYCGAIAGTLGMTNPGALPFTTMTLCLAAFVLCDSAADRIKRLAVAYAVVAIVVAPWFIRNYVLFEKIVMRAGTGHELLKSRSEAGYGIPISEETLLRLEKRGRALNEVQEGEMLTAAIKSAIGNNLLDRSRLILMNLSHYWWEPPRYRDDYSFSYIVGRRIPYYALLIFSIPALMSRVIQASRQGKRYLSDRWMDCIAILLIVADTAVYSYVGGWNTRYHYPVELAMLLFAAQGALVFYDWLGRPLIVSRRAV